MSNKLENLIAGLEKLFLSLPFEMKSSLISAYITGGKVNGVAELSTASTGFCTEGFHLSPVALAMFAKMEEKNPTVFGEIDSYVKALDQIGADRAYETIMGLMDRKDNEVGLVFWECVYSGKSNLLRHHYEEMQSLFSVEPGPVGGPQMPKLVKIIAFQPYVLEAIDQMINEGTAPSKDQFLNKDQFKSILVSD